MAHGRIGDVQARRQTGVAGNSAREDNGERSAWEAGEQKDQEPGLNPSSTTNQQSYVK